jgi:hypothetical protein
MLGAQGLGEGRDLYHATPAVTWGLDRVFFRSHSNNHPIQSPLTTHKDMWRMYILLNIVISNLIVAKKDFEILEDSRY